MKVAIFEGDDTRAIEQNINEFIKDNDITICHVLQSQSDCDSGVWSLTVSIFYK